MDAIAVHFHEIALKGRNRAFFVKALQRNLAIALAPLGRKLSVRLIAGRLLIQGEVGGAEVLRRAQEVFGVATVMPVKRLPRDLDAVAEAILVEVRQRKPASFRISTRRQDKRYPKTSMEVDQLLGMRIHEELRIPVKLEGAEFDAHVLLLPDEVLFGGERCRGVGGLPVGTSGRVTALLSGGIDSPVAAWRMMKRGCHVEFVHFHSYPRVDRASIEKAEELVGQLTRWQFSARLHLVPLWEIQAQTRLNAPEPLRVLLYRRFMVRIAERIAQLNRCQALVTGESIAQVASQTLQNLAAVDAVAGMPILRPLSGMDKQEIIDESMRIGTFPISIEPDQDCCRLFLPRKPALSSSHAECMEAEKALDVEGLVKDALARTELRRFRASSGGVVKEAVPAAELPVLPPPACDLERAASPRRAR